MAMNDAIALIFSLKRLNLWSNDPEFRETI